MNEDRIRIWVARLAAPLAFFVAATVLILLVESGLGSDDDPPEATRTTIATTPTETAPPTTTASQGKKKRKFYRVRAGDTLESIAARFDTEVETLLALNPAIDDPLALQPGQRIRIS